MADPGGLREGPEPRVAEQSTELPAPWVDPWSLLRRDLEAVLASTRLKLQELGRRNRQGDLPLPAFWPGSFASWFWPLVLALVLLLAAGLLRLAWPDPQAPPAAASGPAPAPAVQPPGPLPVAPLPAPPAPTSPPPTRPEAAQPDPVQPEPIADPLLEGLEPEAPSGLIRRGAPEPDRARLQLVLGSGFAELPPADQQRRAERWLERARGLGYERLELVDEQGRPLARSARVGSGMILLTPPPAP
ncbi:MULTISPECIES: hypothetical protein [Aphanothece]|uniref:hypothetical protein n=1 Tax=Aphanothece TaxID=1121 RepID=UPI003985040A